MIANELADELADELENTYPFVGVMEVSAIMLRQQAKEIAMLKQIIDANNLKSDVGQFIKPINEPVAWISVLRIDHIGQKFTDVRVSLTKTDVADIPLYTHPAKELDEKFKKHLWD